MKIIILGAGAIGSVYGALLSREYDVLLIGRPAHVNKINQEGLNIEWKAEETFRIKAKETIEQEDITENTLIILTTKVYDNKEAIEEIKDKLKEDTIILCLQNGLGSEDIVKEIIPNKVIRGLTNTAATFVEPGSVFLDSIEPIFVDDEKVIEIFDKSRIPAVHETNMQKEVWRKAIINSIVNPLTALMKIKNKELCKPEYREIEKAIYNECMICAEKEGFIFRKDVLSLILELIKESKNKSSMLQDIENNRKTEIDYINGAIIKFGEKHNVPTPMNKIIYELIKVKEGKER
jgi:2-dehydropantoate 2-reductase